MSAGRDVRKIECAHHSTDRLDWAAIHDQARRLIEEHGIRASGNLATLGLPLYLDGPGHSGAGGYFGCNAGRNRLLAERFAPLYSLLAGCLSATLGTRLCYHPQLALPGLQLFSASPALPYTGGGWHVDRFATEHPVPRNTCWSATLLLGTVDCPARIAFRSGEDAGEHVVAHEVGRITLFPSDRPHRILPMPAGAECHRLTLQAHVGFAGGDGFLFW